MSKKRWDDFSSPETDALERKYLPSDGEGDTRASQAVTATSKLIYKWFNDGDVYDNTYQLPGWANDLSSYANWLAEYVPETKSILTRIESIDEEQDYIDHILYELYELIFDKRFLASLELKPKNGSIYNCAGPFSYSEEPDEDEDEDEDDYDFYDYGKDEDEDEDEDEEDDEDE